MTDNPRYVTLRDYLRVLREQALVIVLVTLVAGALAYALSSGQTKEYRASAAIGFQDVSQQLSILGGSVSPNTPAEQTPQARAQTIDEPTVAQATKQALGTNIPASRLDAAVNTAVDTKSFLVNVSASWGSADFAAKLANAFAREAVAITNKKGRAQFAASARDLQQRINSLGNSTADQIQRTALIEQLTRLQFLSRNANFAHIVQAAQKPGAPSSPRPKRDTAIGLALGLALGIFVAFLRDSLDRRLRGAREIQTELNFPLLGHVRHQAMGQVVRSDNGHNERFSEDGEGFRMLRRNLEFLSIDTPMHSVLVTSPLPEEGKSTVAASLACASVMAGKRTLLVECDLRRPDLAERFGLAPAPGLTDYLARQAEPREILQTIELAPSIASNGSGPSVAEGGRGALVCITAGSASPQPAELLGSERFRDFLSQVSAAYDIVIIDSSPLLSVADTRELLPNVDGVLLCIRSSQTTREQALAVKAALDHYPERPTGLVVTGLRPRDGASYGYYSEV
jgi:succinoglycan biosynthesis transport protein ExoP